jgi:hypothetical protein
MGSRWLTISPSTGHAMGNISTNCNKASTSQIKAPKPEFYSGNGLLDVKLPVPPATSQAVHKTFTPIDRGPRQRYRCIHIVGPEGERPYCLAQEIVSDATEHAYRVVMIRCSPAKPIIGLARCKRVTGMRCCDSEGLALTRQSASAALCAQYILDLREIVEQHKLILLHPHYYCA